MTFRQRGEYLVASFGTSQLVLHTGAGVPEIVHLGLLPLSDADIDDLAGLLARPRARGTLNVDAPPLVLPEHGSGWQGRPGLRGRRLDGSGWAPRFSPDTVVVDGASASVRSVDLTAELACTVSYELQPASVRQRVSIENLGDSIYELDDLTMAFPVPQHATELLHFTGAWSHEFQVKRMPLIQGAISLDNRRGRTSHDRIPAIVLGEPEFGENHGDVWGLALGWSGNSAIHIERQSNGRAVAQLGELLAPGDVQLKRGESYASPWLEVAPSNRGLNGMSQAFHSSIRTREVATGPDRPRPVLLNTWEAVYFDHKLDTLTRLADRAAEVGGERFVLDDGWFHGRRDDTAGLGDWWVDDEVWPDGLGPLVDHVTGLGLEFGLWFEPEMVNRNSDLYRNHPDWVLTADGYDAIEGRQQLVLNLGKSEVFDYLLAKIDAVLAEYNIGYVKWDMNRDLVQASTGSRASMHDHQLGVYRLFDELRARHPTVEWESCSSGGGRADFEILKRTERIWTSDSNDAHERQHIQRGFSMLFPPEVMGAHIGPPRSHTSGRVCGLSFRATTAFFGHLGIEWNVLETTPEETEQLKDIVALHKQHRPLLHSGDVVRLDVDDDNALAHMVVATDQSEALLSFAQLDLPNSTVPNRLRLFGLDADRRYGISRVPLPMPDYVAAEDQVAWLADGIELSGLALQTLGLQMPLFGPGSAIVIHLMEV